MQRLPSPPPPPRPGAQATFPAFYSGVGGRKAPSPPPKDSTTRGAKEGDHLDGTLPCLLAALWTDSDVIDWTTGTYFDSGPPPRSGLLVLLTYIPAHTPLSLSGFRHRRREVSELIVLTLACLPSLPPKLTVQFGLRTFCFPFKNGDCADILKTGKVKCSLFLHLVPFNARGYARRIVEGGGGGREISLMLGPGSNSGLYLGSLYYLFIYLSPLINPAFCYSQSCPKEVYVQIKPNIDHYIKQFKTKFHLRG